MPAGTYWGRLRARNPYYIGRTVRVKTGYISDNYTEGASPDSDNDLITRTYLMESMSGPDSSGRVQIVAKDPLKLADNERAQCPAPSTGTLLADVAEADVTATLTPAGIGETEYPASGHVRIGKEVMAFTRIADAITFQTTASPSLNGRAQYNTQAQTHSAGDVVQLCKVYSGQQVHDIVYDLLVNFAGMPLNFIPFADWETEADAYLTRLYSAIIVEPTGVKKLLTELVQQCPFYLGYDERQASIFLRAIRATGSQQPALTDEAHFVRDSLSVADAPEERASQVWVYSALIDPTEPLDKASNYGQLYVAADPDAESSDKFGQAAVKRVYSRWIPALNASSAVDLGDRLLEAFTNIPRLISFSLDAKDSDYWTGDQINIETRLIQDIHGDVETVSAQIIQANEAQAGHLFKYVAQSLSFEAASGTLLVIIAEDTNDLNLYDAYRAIYADSGGAVTVECRIQAGVVVGNTDATEANGTAAFTVGDFPDGSVITIVNSGRIAGRGGFGGEGGGWENPVDPLFPEPGRRGGRALKTRIPITVNNLGEIWGGGGGGGGGPNQGAYPQGGVSGGGGAGRLGGPSPANLQGDPGGRSGTDTAGGAAFGGGASGGDPGLVGDTAAGGGIGGQPGYAVDGYSYVTWTAVGDLRGPTTG